MATMGPSEELTDAISRVPTFDREIHDLNEERAILLQKVNYFRSPMISQIPPEVLSRIFWFATSPYRSDPPHRRPKPQLFGAQTLFALSAVCSHWRCIVQSSPQIWTTLLLEKKKSDGQTLDTDYEALVRHYYQRIGTAAMSVYLSDLSPLETTTINQIMQILLCNYPENLGSFHFSGSIGGPFWSQIFQCARQDVEFPQLEELELPWFSTRSPQTIFRNAPQLRTLLLQGGGNWQTVLELPWKQITTLKLHGLHLNDSYHLLSLCPNIIHSGIMNHFRSDVPWAPGQHHTITMEFARKLTWTSPIHHLNNPSCFPVDPVFFMRFRFPAVRKLKWYTLLPSNASLVKDFFAGMQELEELKFSLIKTGNCFGQHVEVFGNLRILRADLTNCDRKELRRWLYRLTVRPGEIPSFPRLERLHLKMGVVTPDELIVVLHSRRSAPVDWFEHEKDFLGLTLPPYDPTSTHWQHHTRLLEFSCDYDRDERTAEAGWTGSFHYDALEAMIKEAIELEGFRYFGGRRCRFCF